MKKSIWQSLTSAVLVVVILVSGVSAVQNGTRIRFRRGATSATVSGTVAKGGPDYYVIRGFGGQGISIRVTGRVTFGADSPEGSMTDDDGNTSWTGTLPADGDNQIRVYSRGGVQKYSLTVSIRGN